MNTTIQVPINTMLADLDESLKTLLKRDLDRHGFDGVEIEFDAPDKEWAASLSSPAVNLFLYDIREAKELRPIDWEERVRDGRTIDLRPPLRIDASYAVTAWTRDVQDEHRLLSQVDGRALRVPDPSAGRAHARARERLAALPAEDPHRPGAPRGRIGLLDRGRRAVQGVVQLRRHPLLRARRLARARARGADRRPTRLFDRDSRNATLLEMHRSGGIVVDGDGGGVRNVWVHMLETGRLAVTDGEGRFRFDRLNARQLHRRRPRPRRERGEGDAHRPGSGRRADARTGPDCRQGFLAFPPIGRKG